MHLQGVYIFDMILGSLAHCQTLYLHWHLTTTSLKDVWNELAPHIICPRRR